MTTNSGLRKIRCAAVWMAAIVLAGCATTANEPAPVAAPREMPPMPTQFPANALRVGTTPTAPPLTFYENGQYRGLDCELARAFGDYIQRPVVFVPLDWNDLIPALETDRVDIVMSGMTVTTARQRQVEFSVPYMEVGQMAIVRREDIKEYTAASQVMLSKGKVAVDPGTTGDLLVQEKFPYAKRVPYPSPEAAADAVAHGKADIFVYDAPTVWWLTATRGNDRLLVLPYTFTNEYLGYAVKKGNDTLLEQVNVFIGALRQSGKLKELSRRWVVVTSPGMR